MLFLFPKIYSGIEPRRYFAVYYPIERTGECQNMNRNIEYTIDTQGDGLRVEQFLRRKGFSRQNLTQLKQMPKSVLVNGEHYFMRRILTAGDRLLICICEENSSEKIIPVSLPLDILYEDEDIIVLNKPADMPTHPSMKNYTNTLANALAWYYKEQEKPFIFRCCNRLDRDTSGVTVAAKHLVSASILSSMGVKQEVTRRYLAIARGSVSPKSGTIDAPLGRKPGSIIERTIDYNTGETAVTHYQLETERNGHSLVSLRLETGRTHQIRIHMKHLGYPLIGDYLYNPDMEHIGRQALHSHTMSFCHPITGEFMEFTAPLPADMASIIY